MSNSRSRSKPRIGAAKAAYVATLMKRFEQANPDPKCELHHHTPFQLLVSVVLSAQTTDKMVNQVMQPLYDRSEGFTPDTVLGLGEAGFLALIRKIGLAPTKAKNVVRLAAIVVEKHGGEIPRTREDLEELPGVGRKTASVILAEIYGEPTMAVDTHVLRVGRRLGLHQEDKPEKAEQALLKTIDKKWLPRAHHWLILHGRYVCKAAKPACAACPMQDLCPSSTAE